MIAETTPDGARQCDYCGLPVPGARPVRSQPQAAPEYCCIGCQFAAAVTRERGQQGAIRWTLARLGLAIFFTMNVLVFTMTLWTQDFYGPSVAGTPLAAALFDLFRWLALLGTLPVLWLLGVPLAESVAGQLRRRQVGSDLLLLVGVIAATAYSAVSVFRGEGHVYFEVSCVVLVAVTLGRWLEATGKLRTTAALDALHKLLPAEARLIVNGTARLTPADELLPGDVVRILPGERFAVDGNIVRGSAAVDQQALTGESRPAIKETGDSVLAGTLNLDGDLLVKVTSVAGEGVLARLIDEVRAARLARGKNQRLADRISTAFMPAVVVVALAVFFWHWQHAGLEHGLMTALAVVLIACPCALGLATPMAVWTALGAASQRQILFRNGEALERLAEVRAIRFDKTGTLTTGVPAVAGFWCANESQRDDAIARAATLAAGSTHVFSLAIAEYAAEELEADEPEADTLTASIEVQSHPGRGLEAVHRGQRTWLGSLRWLNALGLSTPDSLAKRLPGESPAAATGPMAAVGWNGQVRGVFAFREQLRSDATACLAWCRREGLDVAVLTGDDMARGAALAAALAAPVSAGLLPAEKLQAIQVAQRTVGPVAMVGDGINDAPALAAADVGVALGCGADVSRETAGVCLLSDELQRLTEAVQLARRTVQVIRQNLWWSFGYNSLGIAAAATGWLNPVLASVLMTVSSALVIGNSLKLAADAGDGAALPTGASPSASAATNTERPAEAPLELRSPLPRALGRESSGADND